METDHYDQADRYRAEVGGYRNTARTTFGQNVRPDDSRRDRVSAFVADYDLGRS